jgi:hypothetical protein
MNNVTTKKRVLSPAIMVRVDACAYIAMSDKPEKINAIMADRGVDALEAGRIYIIGALNASKRRGTAKNYAEAIEALEAEQVGYRGDPLTRTISADNTARTVSRINALNAGNQYVPDYVSGMAAYTTVVADRTVYGPMVYNTAHYPTTKGEKRSHTRNNGVVAGTFYTEWEAREIEADPANGANCINEAREIEAARVREARNNNIEKNLTVFFAEYMCRLSAKVRRGIANLFDYLDRESGGDALEAEQVIKYLTSAQGWAAPETSKMAVFAVNLHRNFQYKDSVSYPEFIKLMYTYGGEVS